MIIFLADGRLGNQIFQYVFLKTVQKNSEKIIVSGFEDLKEVFEIDDIINLNKENRWIRNFLFRICNPILNFLADKSIISSISIVHEKVLDKYRRETTKYTKQNGLLNFIYFVKPGFFQSEKFFDKSFTKQLKIKDIYLKEANKYFQGISKDRYKVFIHIRRGDYKDHTVYNKSTLLPLNYYKDQIEWFIQNIEKPFFIFLSDEPEFIEKEFGYIKNKIISSVNHYGTDFSIMTQCKSGILSPSSFSWWGSYMMKEKDIVVAPKYWLGFNSRIEYQAQGTPSYAKEVEI